MSVRETASYMSMHNRLRTSVPKKNRFCHLKDKTCKGPIQAALLQNAPKRFLRESQWGPYSIREEDYFWLCVSHHRRYDESSLGRHKGWTWKIINGRRVWIQPLHHSSTRRDKR